MKVVKTEEKVKQKLEGSPFGGQPPDCSCGGTLLFFFQG